MLQPEINQSQTQLEHSKLTLTWVAQIKRIRNHRLRVASIRTIMNYSSSLGGAGYRVKRQPNKHFWIDSLPVLLQDRRTTYLSLSSQRLLRAHLLQLHDISCLSDAVSDVAVYHPLQLGFVLDPLPPSNRQLSIGKGCATSTVSVLCLERSFHLRKWQSEKRGILDFDWISYSKLAAFNYVFFHLVKKVLEHGSWT